MREYRIIAVAVAVLFLIVAAYFIRRSLAPGAGEFDELAGSRIEAACAYKPECKVQAGDLYSGEWDTLWEFSESISQPELDAALPSSGLQAPVRHRLVVLTRNNRVVHQFYEPWNRELTLDHEVIFEDGHHNEAAATRYARTDWLWARRDKLQGHDASYYVLSPDNR